MDYENLDKYDIGFLLELLRQDSEQYNALVTRILLGLDDAEKLKHLENRVW